MSVTIHWFRFDLRLSDNPALTAAARSGQVVPVYILEDQIGEAKGQTPSGLQQPMRWAGQANYGCIMPSAHFNLTCRTGLSSDVEAQSRY